MGAWGPAIFSDDLALDIRGEYRELLEDQVSDEDATRRLVESYRHLVQDEEHILWLALAASQSKLGRLDDHVKARALDVIDSGRGLDLWVEAGPKELAKRKAALGKFRGQLTGPQPRRKPVRPPWRHVTDLQAGDILSFTTGAGLMTLLRVSWIDDDRVGAAPVIEWLEWNGQAVPPKRKLRRLKARGGSLPGLGGPRRPATFRVARHRKKDPDWSESGFVVVARVAPRSRDRSVQAWTYLGWQDLSETIERELPSNGDT